MPMAEAVQAAPMLVDFGLSLVGPGLLGGGFLLGFVKLRTEVRLYRAENQKDHKVLFGKLDELNGVGRKNTTAIAERAAVCEERHS